MDLFSFKQELAELLKSNLILKPEYNLYYSFSDLLDLQIVAKEQVLTIFFLFYQDSLKEKNCSKLNDVINLASEMKKEEDIKIINKLFLKIKDIIRSDKVENI